MIIQVKLSLKCGVLFFQQFLPALNLINNLLIFRGLFVDIIVHCWLFLAIQLFVFVLYFVQRRSNSADFFRIGFFKPGQLLFIGRDALIKLPAFIILNDKGLIENGLFRGGIMG